MTKAIELVGVTKTFGTNVAVNNLDLSVPTGSIYGFVGPNGSGKTTTLRMILRIFQPDRGDVVVLGNSVGKTADDRLGYLPEERGLYKRMKVRDLLTYYARLKGHYNCKADIDHWLERLDAASWANKKIDALSKGMAQKVQFISTVIARPQLIILDEPFSGLDPINMESLREAVLALREQGATIVFSTHDMDMAERLCDTVFMIFRGNKVLDGTMEAIQAEYPANRVRVSFIGEDSALPHLRGIENASQSGRYHEFTLQNVDESQRVLAELSQQRSLSHFEIIKPSLHDIFVQIARPEALPEQNELVA